MTETALINNFKKVTEDKGINVYLVNTDKFKTNSIHIFFHDNLTREHSTLNALLPMVLRRGTKKLPTFQAISKYMEELYGASFDCGINKKGERHLMFFYTECVNDRYTSAGGNLFNDAFGFLAGILLEPYTENGKFKEEYVNQEKDNLKKIIEGRVNDKLQYSIERCYEEMCKEERFGIYEYGDIRDLEKIDADTLYRHYQTALETMPIDIFVVGDVDEKSVENAFRKSFGAFGSIRKNIARADTGTIHGDVETPKRVFEKMEVNQGKLCLGFRTGTAPSDSDYYSLIVCNGILGGGVHSKLFQNVREKAGLAYYAFSRLEKFKGLMLIGTGIEIDNCDKVIDIALQQLNDIKEGKITDFEYDSTIKSIETSLKYMVDSHSQTVDFFLSQLMSGENSGFAGMIDKIKNVHREDVVRVAQKIKLDTIYFLSNKERC